MNGQLCKNLKKFASIKNFNYKVCKKIYQQSSPKEREDFREEMEEIIDNYIPPIKHI
jgi:hypothetical protein